MKEVFDNWVQDHEESIADASGGDWDDLVKLLLMAFEEGVIYGRNKEKLE